MPCQAVTQMMMRVGVMMMKMIIGYDVDEDAGCFVLATCLLGPKHLRDGSLHVYSSCKRVYQRPMGAIPARALALHNTVNGATGEGREGILPEEP